MKVLLIKTGTTVPNVKATRGDFEHWFAAGLGVPDEALDVVNVFEGMPLPNPETMRANAVVITGSAALVTDREAWSEATAAWLKRAISVGTPTLAVCYGHQLLAHALGGRVDHNRRGRNVGTVDVTTTALARQDALFGQLPETVHVPVSHVQHVTQLPGGARRLAATAKDDNHAFAIGEHVWSVQFHPEFDAEIVRGYIDARRDTIAAEGLNPHTLSGNALDTEHGRNLLRAFTDKAKRVTNGARRAER